MKPWKTPSTPNSVLVIGDVIEDIYIQGQVVGIANEDPVPKFRPNLKHNIKYGGAQFVADSVQTYGKVPVGLFPTTESTILRHIDERYNRNVFTVDNIPTVKLWSPEDLLPALEEKPNTIIVWDDRRSPGAMDLVQEALYIALLEDILPKDLLLIVDSPSVCWNIPMVSYWKMNSEEYHRLPPQLLQTNTIVTSAKQVLLHRNRKTFPFPVPTSYDPVDTIGAGDVFLSVFSIMIKEGVGIDIAIREAIMYSADSVQHPGCYMPPRDYL